MNSHEDQRIRALGRVSDALHRYDMRQGAMIGLGLLAIAHALVLVALIVAKAITTQKTRAPQVEED